MANAIFQVNNRLQPCLSLKRQVQSHKNLPHKLTTAATIDSIKQPNRPHLQNFYHYFWSWGTAFPKLIFPAFSFFLVFFLPGILRNDIIKEPCNQTEMHNPISHSNLFPALKCYKLPSNWCHRQRAIVQCHAHACRLKHRGLNICFSSNDTPTHH